jgi:hypothetical protein
MRRLNRAYGTDKETQPMPSERQKNQHTREAPRGGEPGDGAGRIEDTGTRHAGVWPASGPHPDDAGATYQGMASFGQGDRGAAGYEDHGDSEVRTVPPATDTGGNATRRDRMQLGGQAGEPSSNAGEVDPGVAASRQMIGGEGAERNNPPESEASPG